ncbi:hypothetical protein [Pseudoxanthomonas sp.]|uniref:hypothetical protein n=1 Tax=Pseudoxanthomonas sp. TaxID=1871049 RepID=UPI002FE2DF6F
MSTTSFTHPTSAHTSGPTLLRSAAHAMSANIAVFSISAKTWQTQIYCQQHNNSFEPNPIHGTA